MLELSKEGEYTWQTMFSVTKGYTQIPLNNTVHYNAVFLIYHGLKMIPKYSVSKQKC